MKKATKQKQTNNNFKIELSCWKIDEDNDQGDSDQISAKP
jgi:hypothetical protein